MKTMKSKQFLFLAALGCMAAPVAAQTVDVSILCGQTYTIKSTVPASAGEATITYRWLENGSTVTGTAATYTVPKTKSVGVYTYIRQAMTDGCPDWQSSNAFTVEVKNKNDLGVCLGGIMWAKYNVDEFGTFAESLEAPGKLYRFNDTTAFPPTGTCDWPAYIADTTDVWLPENDPCPTGWRMLSVPDGARLRGMSLTAVLSAELNGLRVNLACPTSNCTAAMAVAGAALAYTSAGLRNSSGIVSNSGAYKYSSRGSCYSTGYPEYWSWACPTTYAYAIRCVEK
jgi:hypothetical protein